MSKATEQIHFSSWWYYVITNLEYWFVYYPNLLLIVSSLFKSVYPSPLYVIIIVWRMYCYYDYYPRGWEVKEVTRRIIEDAHTMGFKFS